MTSHQGLPPHDNDDPAAGTVRVGGMSRGELLEALLRHGVRLNDSGLALFADDRFTTSGTSLVIRTCQATPAGLGFAQGATFAEIEARAAGLGLSLCPLELGPHLRLQLLDQPEGSLGHPPSRHRAPPGSITIASRPLAQDDATPKGFYLRRIDGVPWLRGYHAGPGHVWSPDDLFVFSLGEKAC